MSFAELQKRCKELNLEPCSGKSITKEILKAKIDDFDSKIENRYEHAIAENNYTFYQSIKDLIPKMPDFRPQRTVEKMKESEYLELRWRELYNELQGLGEDNESKNRKILDAINSDDNNKLLEVLEDEKSIESFFESYPAIIWLAGQTGTVIKKMLIYRGDIQTINSLDKDEVKEMIPFINSDFIAEQLYKINPDALEFNRREMRDAVEKGEFGKVLWINTKYPGVLFTKGESYKEAVMIKEGLLNDNVTIFKLSVNSNNLKLIFWLLSQLPGWDYYFKDEAIIQNNLNVLNALIDANIMPSSIDLQIAINSDPAIFDLILSKVDVDPALHLISRAIFRGKREYAKKMILKSGNLLNMDAMDEILSAAVDYGDIEMVKFLLNHYPDIELSYLLISQSIRKPEILKLFLDDGRADPTIGNIRSTINYAILNRMYDSAKLLLNDKRVKNSLTREELIEYNKKIN